MVEQEKKALTPYQGRKRCFGYFLCEKCKRRWMSANSWANMGQKCVTCDTNVYPQKQRPLKKPKKHNRDPEKRHREDLCEKCIRTRQCCRNLHV